MVTASRCSEIKSILANNVPTLSRIWTTVISVATVTRSRKAVRSSTRVLQRAAICLSTSPVIFFNKRFPANNTLIMANKTEGDVRNLVSFAYDWIKSLQQQTCRNMTIRIFPCLDCGVMFSKGDASCAKSNASHIASSRAWILSSRWTCSKKVWHPDELRMSAFPRQQRK